MKKTLIYAITLVALLNIWQFFDSYHQRQTAMVADWAGNRQLSVASTTSSAGSKASTIAAPAATPAVSTTTPAAPAPEPSTAVSTATARLDKAGLKSEYAALYLDVQAKTGTPWQILAAVHRIETGQRGDTAITSYAGAQGPMQFMPATFRAYGQDGDGDGDRTITDLEDAMLSAGNYLAANGAAKGNYRNALYRYNHSNSYVNEVLDTAHTLGL